MLRCVRAHLEPYDTVDTLELYAAHDDVPVMETLRAEGDAGMYLAIVAVLYDDVVVRAVARVFVGESSLAAFEHYGIVIDTHVAAADEYVVAEVDVYRVT